GIFRYFSPNLFSQGGSLASSKLSKNSTKSSPFAVKDFEKSIFLFNRGIKRSQYCRIGEYFNNE
ncbi:MAG: hypothetical protein IJN80_07385, partial [Clostridia bacterium]|nr:hypothetical protein [Clostridia bacterium]